MPNKKMLLFKYMIELKVDHHMSNKNPIEQNDSMKTLWNQHSPISRWYGINITNEAMC
jgi:hypothetical protein